jgi:hypothetical protein
MGARRDRDRWHGKPLYQAMVERVRKEGLAGANLPVLDEMVGERMVTVERSR